MSGGISAIRGFDYQATVILDLLLQHFERHGPNAIVRPEGEDDLDLRWTKGGVEHHCFMPKECLLLLDLVEGSEPPGFGRDLATFVRALPSATLRLIVFGQERVFREGPLRQHPLVQRVGNAL